MMNEKAEQESLTLRYNLFDLPTAQHKAGLAGLLVMIESMRRRELEPLPEIVDLSPTGAAISLTRESLQSVYNEFFAPQKDKKGKIVPKAAFLEVMGMPPLWLALWRDIIKGGLRAGAPAQMNPFKYRYFPEKRPKEWDWEKMWQSLLKQETMGICGTHIPGNESANAEKVESTASAQQMLLLLFWPVVSLPYVTQELTIPKSRRIQDYLFSYYAYVIAIPEVACLDYFVQKIFELYPQSLSDDAPGKAPRPTQSVISTEKEAALLFASQQYAGIDTFPTLDMVSSLNIIHLKYGQGSPDIIEDSIIAPDESLLKLYKRITSSYFNPLFKRQLIENLFMQQSWYHGMHDLFANHPKEFFIQCPESPKKIYGFFRDVKKKFFSIQEDNQMDMEGYMSVEENKEELLALRIRGLVRQYVQRKAESKSGMTFKEFKKDEKGKTIYPTTYREAVEKVCMDAFLALRGRREQDFVEYFTGTLCSVPQYLPKDDFLLVSQALINERDKVKALSMLAVSACSYLPVNKERKKDNKGEKS
jgi:CRISPR-associated protein Cmx8